ncbi:hypothetical protein MPSEU_000585500 [Mayamaea pseudoterrestris]|nr:hypothetical protein MPSEU_000585500 [Mayamaea pseudoterrestris]
MYKMFAPIVGSESILCIDKKDWQPKRKAFVAGFAPTFLRHMVDVMIDKLHRLEACIDYDIQSDQATNMLERCQTFTSDVIASVAFGEDWGGGINAQHPARSWHSEIARLFAGMMTDPLAQMFGFETKRKIRKYEKLIEDEMMAVLERRLQASESVGGEAEKRDICSLAIATMTHDGETLSQEDKVWITHQLKTFYLGGHDTTASTVSWAIWMLSQKPHILAKLRAELEEQGVWLDKHHPPTYDSLCQCIFLEATVKETLRLYPPFGNVSRMTDDDTEEWNGYRLSGAVLAQSIYIMGRHPILWKDPETFRPERFLDGSEDPPNSRYGTNVKFTAFSKGPRDCLGKYFALLEAKLAISFLVSRFDFDCLDPNEGLKVMISSFPANGALISFKRRESE